VAFAVAGQQLLGRFSGFKGRIHEGFGPRRKNVLIDYEKIRTLAGFNTFEAFQAAHRSWIDGSLKADVNTRKQRWTKSVAVGSNTFATLYSVSISLEGKRAI